MAKQGAKLGHREPVTIEVTEDMAQSLVECFDAYAQEGVVTLELHAGGVWLRNPLTSSRQFLGSAKPLDWGPLKRPFQ